MRQCVLSFAALLLVVLVGAALDIRSQPVDAGAPTPTPTPIFLPVTAKMYWTDVNAPYTVSKADLNGSGVETILSGLTQPIALALGAPNNKLYWVESPFPGKIRRANLDGTGAEDVLTGLGNPGAIALDLSVSGLNESPALPAVEKQPEGNAANADLSVPKANLWICEAGPCAGPGEGALRVVEHAFGVQDGLGAYEFTV